MSDKVSADRLREARVNIEGVHQVLIKAERDGLFATSRSGSRSHTGKGTYISPEHAARVAWRVTKDWLEAVLVLVAARMATIDEVMLPYLHVQIGGEEMTLFEHYKAQEARALEAGGTDG